MSILDNNTVVGSLYKGLLFINVFVYMEVFLVELWDSCKKSSPLCGVFGAAACLPKVACNLI
jgi:hypothetical protein